MRKASLLPYLLLGAVLWIVGLSILLLRLGTAFGIAFWPLLWAYSQLALVMAVVGESSPWTIQVSLWLLGYLTLGLVIWWLLARMKPDRRSSQWLRAGFGWLVMQGLLGLTAWILFQQGRLPME